VWPQHALNSNDARKVDPLIHLEIGAPAVEAQRLQRDVKADLVAVLETVGYGLGCPKDTYRGLVRVG